MLTVFNRFVDYSVVSSQVISDSDVFFSVHRNVDWMVPADMAILRLLAAPKPLQLSPGNIAQNTGYSREHVSNRCRTLLDHRLLEVEENGDPFFSVTELGQQVVDQEVSPDVLES